LGNRSPEAHIRRGDPKPSPVFETYWRFARERQNIFLRRFVGQEEPWTEDPILRAYKFTNAFRASDRASQFLIARVLPGEQNPTELFFRVILYKLFNRPQTWELIKRSVGEISARTFSFDKYCSILDSAQQRGETLYSAAYIMPMAFAAQRGRKHRSHIALLGTMLAERLPERLAECASLEAAYRTLRGYAMMGPFLAYQYVIDLNYSSLLQFSEMEFVIPGPGARSGLRKCFTSLGDRSEADAIRWMTDQQESSQQRLGLEQVNLWGRRLQLIDCQNLFCETDKYARVRHPNILGIGARTSLKRRYRCDFSQIPYVYPDRWGLTVPLQTSRA
jgi:5-hmdU DNA kinase, helical domain